MYLLGTSSPTTTWSSEERKLCVCCCSGRRTKIVTPGSLSMGSWPSHSKATKEHALGEPQRQSLQGINTEFRICPCKDNALSCKVLHGQKRYYVQEWRCPKRKKNGITCRNGVVFKELGFGKAERRLKLHHYYALRGCWSSTLTDSMLILKTQSQV